MSVQTAISNLETVQQIYAAFGMGDVPAILDRLSDNAVWEHYGNTDLVPFAGKFAGKGEILRFFQIMGENTRFSDFQPRNFREEGNTVINEVYMEVTAVPTGKNVRLTATFYWTFDGQGKVSHWKNEGDAHLLDAAFTA
ncbi:MAG: nuclear transport factor 2 family protein [Lewinellaceae bacterium]|nr:nuclear transport factor 2 family protein [Lewinella sp.]MCB9281290.1 nuclear transport factor 2 family protein [Lewinellaceae bacterium]